MLRGVSYLQPKLEPLTFGNVFGSLLPTPTATEGGRSKSASPNSKIRPSLGMMAARDLWPTPTTQDAKNNAGPSQWNRNTQPLNVQASAADGGTPTQPKGQLNPAWVEWLMGWPIGWTDLEPLEMAKFRSWLQSHFFSFDQE